MDIWAIIKSINETKQNLEEEPDFEKTYNPWLVNKSLSFFIDTVLYSNEMNMNSHLDHNLQNSYYINNDNIRPRKRFSKWYKKKDDEDLNAVMKYYGYNINKAKSALSILSIEQLTEIKEKFKE